MDRDAADAAVARRVHVGRPPRSRGAQRPPRRDRQPQQLFHDDAGGAGAAAADARATEISRFARCDDIADPGAARAGRRSTGAVRSEFPERYDRVTQIFRGRGEVRKAISVVKKRSSTHEFSVREYQLSSEGVRVGPVLLEFQGVLTGTPSYTGTVAPLLRDAPHGR